LVANLFSANRTEVQAGAQTIADAAREPSRAPKVLSEAWFVDHWALLEHATRSALAAAFASGYLAMV
jgi:hypothetical protein